MHVQIDRATTEQDPEAFRDPKAYVPFLLGPQVGLPRGFASEMVEF